MMPFSPKRVNIEYVAQFLGMPKSDLQTRLEIVSYIDLMFESFRLDDDNNPHDPNVNLPTRAFIQILQK